MAFEFDMHRTKYGFFDVVKGAGGSVTVEHIAEKYDEYGPITFDAFACDAAEALQVVKAWQAENRT